MILVGSLSALQEETANAASRFLRTMGGSRRNQRGTRRRAASELFEKGQNMSRRQAVRFALDSAPK